MVLLIGNSQSFCTIYEGQGNGFLSLALPSLLLPFLLSSLLFSLPFFLLPFPSSPSFLTSFLPLSFLPFIPSLSRYYSFLSLLPPLPSMQVSGYCHVGEEKWSVSTEGVNHFFIDVLPANFPQAKTLLVRRWQGALMQCYEFLLGSPSIYGKLWENIENENHMTVADGSSVVVALKQ